MRIATIALVLVALPAFGGAVSTAGETLKKTMEWCGKGTKMPEKVCECVGERAEAELNERQQRFFIAMISKNKADQDRLRGDMTVNELTQVAMLATTAPQNCER